MSEMELELYRQHRAVQQKHTYFLLAAVGACLGFALTQTSGMQLSKIQIPLAIALVMWGLSFYAGCRSVVRGELVLFTNMELVKVQQGRNPEVGQNPYAIKQLGETLITAIERHSNKASFSAKWQFRCFVLGVLAYISWHVLNMYARGLPELLIELPN